MAPNEGLSNENTSSAYLLSITCFHSQWRLKKKSPPERESTEWKSCGGGVSSPSAVCVVFFILLTNSDSAACSRVSVLCHQTIISSGKIPWLTLVWLLCWRWSSSSSDFSSRPVGCLRLVLQGRGLWEPVWWSEPLTRLLLQSTTHSRSLSP